jgi:hypothetical protein
MYSVYSYLIVEYAAEQDKKENALNLNENRVIDRKNVIYSHAGKDGLLIKFAVKNLVGKLKPLQLDCVTVWENDRTFCSFRAD